jgi:hypothetical protein
VCNDDPSRDQAAQLTQFERWVQCIGSEVPRTYRYPKLRYRAPERGWLVLRGRRGHYRFADEVRAYDLQTGAAYVASSQSALVLDGPGVDYAATDAARKPESFTGNVAADLVREIAFVLLTARAPTPKRSRLQAVALPPGLPVTLSPGKGVASMLPQEPWSGSSAQTKITYELVGAGAPVRGEFTWPDSYVPAEEHADVLLRSLEAGLERGCARAGLRSGEAASASIGRRRGGRVADRCTRACSGPWWASWIGRSMRCARTCAPTHVSGSECGATRSGQSSSQPRLRSRCPSSSPRPPTHRVLELTGQIEKSFSHRRHLRRRPGRWGTTTGDAFVAGSTNSDRALSYGTYTPIDQKRLRSVPGDGHLAARAEVADTRARHGSSRNGHGTARLADIRREKPPRGRRRGRSPADQWNLHALAGFDG